MSDPIPQIFYFIPETCYEYKAQNNVDDCEVKAYIAKSKNVPSSYNEGKDVFFHLNLHRKSGEFTVKSSSDPDIKIDPDTLNYIYRSLNYGIFLRRVIYKEMFSDLNTPVLGNTRLKDLPVKDSRKLSRTDLSDSMQNIIFYLSYGADYSIDISDKMNTLNDFMIDSVVYLALEAPLLDQKFFTEVLPKLESENPPFLGAQKMPQEVKERAEIIKRIKKSHKIIDASLPSDLKAQDASYDLLTIRQKTAHLMIREMFSPRKSKLVWAQEMGALVSAGVPLYNDQQAKINFYDSKVNQIKQVYIKIREEMGVDLSLPESKRLDDMINFLSCIEALSTVRPILRPLNVAVDDNNFIAQDTFYQMLLYIKSVDYDFEKLKFQNFSVMVDAYVKEGKNLNEVYDLFHHAFNSLVEQGWIDSDDVEANFRMQEVMSFFLDADTLHKMKDPRERFDLSLRMKYNGSDERRFVISALLKNMPTYFSGESIRFEAINFTAFYNEIKIEYQRIQDAVALGEMDRKKAEAFLIAANDLMITLLERGGEVEYFYGDKFVKAPNFYDQITSADSRVYDDMKEWIKGELLRLGSMGMVVPLETPHYNLGTLGLSGDLVLAGLGGLGFFLSEQNENKRLSFTVVLAGLGGAAFNLGSYALDLRNEYYLADIAGTVVFGILGYFISSQIFPDSNANVFPSQGDDPSQLNTVTDYGYLRIRF